ncbi:hypothetical protein CEUSTIGMA_g13526.t1 [Chlamydomonas eustigma]|uniref:THIF-type NAD/FAD binding fold domain-containing protein n=1 Tax=Chlamydomonas eustigma TaxID=1157962 RepID=A0A250XSX2_9CHLO|nr:hypothetical protein CEUSTIGMA_g13526.t1 [Chlamydomonas eustigma]|eukprot:GAX86113.1 hypothetical protein CEUSTIGMA_g13526.t1 [Chlamydomonas eustigma]
MSKGSIRTIAATSLTSFASSILGATLYHLFIRVQTLRRKKKHVAVHNHTCSLAVNDQKTDTELSRGGTASSVKRFREDEILSEQLTRNVQFFGEAPQQKIAESFVIVVGLGGVGSHAAHLLLRSGVGKLRLIDFDQVTLSSLNRHALATREDVGTSKARCLEKHFRNIMPEAEIECVTEMYTADKEEQLLSGSPDFVLDAIDNIDTKAALIAGCKRRGLRVLAVAGAGAKADPTRLRVVDLSEASVDPLSKAVRQKLRSDHGLWGEVPVLLSLEKPLCKLVSMVDLDGGVDPLDYQIVPNFRVRTIPVLGTTPALFGMAAASYVLCHLAGAPWKGEPLKQPLSKEYERLLKDLREREIARFGEACPPCPLDMDDIIFITREMYRGFSARHMKQTVAPGGDKGLTRSVANMTLTRWDKRKSPTVDNVVLLTCEEADKHDETELSTLQQQEPLFVNWVQKILDHARRQYFY